MSARTLLAAAAALACLGHVLAADFVVSKATRRIDATRHVVTAATTYTVKGGSGSEPFLVAFPQPEAEHVAVVTAEGEKGTQKLAVRAAPEHKKEGWVHYAVDLGTAAAAGSEFALTVTAVYTDVLAPLPRSISQFEPHLVKLTLSPYIGSPYAVGRQVTTVKLPNPARIEGHGAEGDAAKHVTKEAGGAKFKWGPYPDVPAYRAGSAWIHFEITAPFATLATVTREVEVSLWGNVAVEEHYDLRHTGAALKGGFSRLDYQMKNARGNSFSSLTAHLPVGASDVYYRDVIGNISTSHVRTERDGSVTMELEPRFPLFGGWKTAWYQGYSAPIGPYVTTSTADAGLHRLSFDAHIPYHGLPIREYTLKVVLPEGAQVVDVAAPFPHTLSASRRWTYLDAFTGRPVVVIRGEGTVVSHGVHDGNVVVTFRYAPSTLWTKPAYLVVAFLALFLTATVASRINLSLGARAGSSAAVGAAEGKAQ